MSQECQDPGAKAKTPQPISYALVRDVQTTSQTVDMQSPPPNIKTPLLPVVKSSQDIIIYQRGTLKVRGEGVLISGGRD